MYAETGLLYPYFQNFSSEIQHFEEFCGIQRAANVSTGNLVPTSSVWEYNLGGEGDLFKAPEPIIEEPLIGLDPMSAAISMISCGNDVISPQPIKVVDIESFQSEHLLSEVFYECKKDLLAKSAIGEQLCEVLDTKTPAMQTEKDLIAEKDGLISLGSIQRSISSGCLGSMDWMHGGAMSPNFLDFHGLDFSSAYGMRRAFSEGDIHILNNGNTNLNQSPFESTLTIVKYNVKERMEKLSRYRKKKQRRNFGRTIKYACRKALADNQPRVRGRFAKTEESRNNSNITVRR